MTTTTTTTISDFCRLAKLASVGMLLLLLLLSLPRPALAFSRHPACGPPIALSRTYLAQLSKYGIGTTHHQFVNNFVPSAYYHGRETVKYVSTSSTELDDDLICVDGETQARSGGFPLYDDGTHGDDVPGDGVYSRDCVHFCESYVDFNDYWGYAFERRIEAARLVAVDPALEGTIPHEILPNPFYPRAKLLATSHAAFFVDDQAKYFPEWPLRIPDTRNYHDSPTGQSLAFGAVLSVFGDVFDFLTLASFEMNKALPGTSMFRWQKWDRQGADAWEQRIGSACALIRCHFLFRHLLSLTVRALFLMFRRYQQMQHWIIRSSDYEVPGRYN